MNTDVLVLGAGPAGTTLAADLARRGFAVTIADKKDFPRHKACGEFLSPECRPILRDLGVDEALRAESAWLVRGMRLHAGANRALGRFRRLAQRGEHGLAGLGIRRDRFDLMLLQAARGFGAGWLPRHTFAGLRRDADGRVVGATLRNQAGEAIAVQARYVVAADGVHSLVAKELGWQRRVEWLDRFALTAHFRSVKAEPTAEVHLYGSGYFAATTVDRELFSLNLVLPRRELRDRDAADWDGFVAERLQLAPELAARLEGAERMAPWRGIGPMAYRTTRRAAPGVALVGDACGYADPLTGEGIFFALFGGKALAEQVAATLDGTTAEADAMAAYEAARKREIEPRLRASMLLQRAIRYPWLVRSFVRMAAALPALADLIVTLSGDTIHPRDLRSPAFWREFGRAETA
jgi:flavin-dependent dehydrogenase